MNMTADILGIGAIILIEYPYEDKNNSKTRPAVVISYDMNTTAVVLLKISSVNKYADSKKYPYAYKIKDLNGTGLKKASFILTNKELQISNKTPCKAIGRLAQNELRIITALHNKAVLEGKNVVQIEKNKIKNKMR